MSFFRKLREHWADILAVLSLTALVIAFNWRFVDGREVFAFRDLSRYFYPFRFLMVQQVKAGILPLWDPNIFCGFPLLATLQVGVFYPLTAIHYILPYGLAFNWYTIIHYILAALFTYALLRYYRLPVSAAFFGGYVFAFSGYLLSVSNMNTSLSAVIWLPLIILFFDRLLRGARPVFDFIILALLLALMFLGGEPTIYYITAWLLGAYALVFARRRLWAVGLLAAALLTSLALIAIQLLPFLELSRLSDRLVRTGYEIVSSQSLPPREVLTFLLPYFFGNMGSAGSYNRAILGEANQFWLISAYIGIIPLIMTFFAFRLPVGGGAGRKLAWFFAGAALFGLLLALGAYTPFYWLAYHLMPGLALIRYPIKYVFLITFCLSVLSAFGFTTLADDVTERRENFGRLARRLAPFAGVAAVASLLAFRFAQAIFDWVARYYPPNYPVEIFGKLAELVSFNIMNLFDLAGYLAALLAVFYLVYRGKLSRKYFMALIILLAVADLFANGVPVQVGIPARIYREMPPNYKLLARDKQTYRFTYSYRLGGENRYTYGENYAQAMEESKDNFADNWHLLFGLQSFSGYESIQPLAWRKLATEKFNDKNFIKNLDYLSRSNVRYIAAIEDWHKPQLKLLRHKRNFGLDVNLYENTAYMPRAYLLGDTRGRVQINKYSPLEVVITVKARRPDKLFLSDSYYPGWKAYLDGKEVPIERSLTLFRAVKVPFGRHVVRFVYDPLSFKIGAIISLITAVLLATGLILERNSKNGVDDRT